MAAQDPTPPQPPAPSLGGPNFQLLLGLAVLAGIGWALFSFLGNREDPVHTIRYEVTGTARSVSITLATPTGGTEQAANRAVPLSVSFTAEPGDFLYISAQNDRERGEVTCSIYKDGVLVERSTSVGAYVICSATTTA